MSARRGIEEAEALIAATRDVEDPWLLSFADLVVNLLAFFVLLVSMATISFDTLEALPTAFDSATRDRPTLRTLSTEVSELVEAEGLVGRVVTRIDDEGLAIQIQDRIVFQSGVASLASEGRPLVTKIARLLERLPERYRVLVEGHTDDVPIATAQFPSNWELSAARALEVRRELAAAGVSDRRLSVKALADTEPLPRVDGEGLELYRQKNRRVVIRVY